MNDSLYEEYMRSVLGYQPMNNHTYGYGMNFETANMLSMNTDQMS